MSTAQCWAYIDDGPRLGDICGLPAVEICRRRGMSVCAHHADGGRDRGAPHGPRIDVEASLLAASGSSTPPPVAPTPADPP